MPLLSSPIDGSPMREIERYGVKIDVCTSSGGVWLDRGELEKIIMMIRQEALQEAQQGAMGAGAPPPPPQAQAQRGYDDDYDRGDRGDSRKGKKRDGVLDNLMDLFDF